MHHHISGPALVCLQQINEFIEKNDFFISLNTVQCYSADEPATHHKLHFRKKSQ